MAASVVVITARKRRNAVIAQAMAKGIKAAGDRFDWIDERDYRGPRGWRVAVFYGLSGNLRRAFDDFRQNERTVVNIDLGYWGRKEGGTLAGFHKIAVGARHPTAYFQRRAHDAIRVARFGLKIQPWRNDGMGDILLAGMSGKASGVDGRPPESWERDIIARLQQHTDRRIVYRPKPSFKEATRLPGAKFIPPTEKLETVLARAWAVVTHHSNVAVDGLIAGIPAFCWEGVAAPMALQDLARIEEPLYPEEREQWIADIAWTQFSVAEMADGTAWRHLKDDGLVP